MTDDDRPLDRDALVSKFADYARAVSCKIARDLPIDEDEAIAAGNVGLLQAAQKFDIQRALDGEQAGIGPLEANFRSLAYLRIRGEIYDEIRRSAFTKRRGFEHGIKFDMISLDRRKMTKEGEVPALELATEDDLGDLDHLELTELEKKVAAGSIAGYSGPEIAKFLEISPHRIGQVRKSIRLKLAESLA